MLTYVNMGDILTDGRTDRLTNLGKFYSCSMQLKIFYVSICDGRHGGEVAGKFQRENIKGFRVNNNIKRCRKYLYMFHNYPNVTHFKQVSITLNAIFREFSICLTSR